VREEKTEIDIDLHLDLSPLRMERKRKHTMTRSIMDGPCREGVAGDPLSLSTGLRSFG
jgi:hypothetical protein